RDGVHQCLAIDVNRNEAVHRAAYTDGNRTLLKLFDDLPDASHKGLPYQLWILFTVMREGLQGRVVELCRMQYSVGRRFNSKGFGTSGTDVNSDVIRHMRFNLRVKIMDLLKCFLVIGIKSEFARVGGAIWTD